MATRKTASKSSSRAKINIPAVKKSSTKKTVKSAEKQLKKVGGKGLIAVILCMIIGVAAGAGAFFYTSANDTFELIGSDEITITLNDKYVEQGVKIIEFGKDISGEVKTDGNLKLTEEGLPKELGTFYLKYSVDSIKYGKIFKIEKVRLISVVEPSEGENVSEEGGE